VHTFIVATMLAGGSGISSGLGINAVAFLSQVISFAIVFYILWKWGFPAITNILDKRQAVIREGIENAEKAKRDLAEANARAEQILTDARRQVQETIERAAQAAQQEANRIQEEAQARAEQISQQQIARIQQEANRARAELSRLVVNLSIEAAGKVINKSVDTKDNRRLVEEFVSTTDNTRNN
jgi:F-type H+-transporting ATPase subunit b